LKQAKLIGAAAIIPAPSASSPKPSTYKMIVDHGSFQYKVDKIRASWIPCANP
jgi:hypothetical protein